MEFIEYLNENEKVLFEFKKVGINNIETFLNYKSIYDVYNSYKNVNSKMQRIELTAEKCKVYTTTVRTAIKTMQSIV